MQGIQVGFRLDKMASRVHTAVVSVYSNTTEALSLLSDIWGLLGEEQNSKTKTLSRQNALSASAAVHSLCQNDNTPIAKRNALGPGLNHMAVTRAYHALSQFLHLPFLVLNQHPQNLIPLPAFLHLPNEEPYAGDNIIWHELVMDIYHGH